MPTEIRCPKCGSAKTMAVPDSAAFLCYVCKHEFVLDKVVQPLRIFLSYGHDHNEGEYNQAAHLAGSFAKFSRGPDVGDPYSIRYAPSRAISTKKTVEHWKNGRSTNSVNARPMLR